MSTVTFLRNLGIMVTWSPGEVDMGIQSLLVQFYPILLSTLFSINRQQLSRFEAYFALVLSSSPLTVYLVVASIGDFFGINTGLYKRIKSHRTIIRVLGALVPFIWTGLSMALMMSTTAFKDPYCSAGNFAHWFRYIIDMLKYTLVFPGGMYDAPPGIVWIIMIPWLACLARRWPQLRADTKLHSEGASRMRVLCTWVKCAWCVPVDIGPRLAKSNTIKVHY